MNLLPNLEIQDTSVQALERAVRDRLAEDWTPPSAGLVAPDLVLDLCAQYVANTRRVQPTWDADALVGEYLRQMEAEQWATVRRLAARPRRGSATAQRLFLALVGAALERRDRRPLGTPSAALLLLGVYTRALLGLGPAAIHPLPLPLRHRDLRRHRLDPEDAWGGRVTRAALRRHVEAGGLRAGPSLLHGWRLALVAVAVARRGAVALARARGEEEVTRATLERALEAVEGELLGGGQLWGDLARSPLLRDTVLSFLSRKASVATLLM